MAGFRELAPHTVVVPILDVDLPKPPRFLGTGFFVGPNGLLLTSAHVVTDCVGQPFVVTMSSVQDAYRLDILEMDEAHDLAVARVRIYRPDTHLNCAFEANVAPNVPILTFEYGTTQKIGRETRFNPATRMGNVTRMFDGRDLFGAAGEHCLELSFPALRGASGAPVLDSRNLDVWGVVVANASYELLPAQVDRVFHDDDRVDEEIKYMLPQAIAVNIKHAEALVRPHL